LQPVSAVPANLRLANQTALLGQLLGRKAASRAELAKATGMSKPTTGKIIDDLMHAGVVEEIKLMDGGRPSVGRPGKQLRLATNRSRFVTVDLGVELTRISGLPPSPPEQDRWEIQFKTPTTADAWQEKVAQSAEKINIKRPWAVLVSTPGVVVRLMCDFIRLTASVAVSISTPACAYALFVPASLMPNYSTPPKPASGFFWR